MVRAVTEDDESTVDSVQLQFWSPTGDFVGSTDMVPDPDYTDSNHYMLPAAQPFVCSERWLLRAIVTNVANQTGQRDRWLNSPIAVQNGGFEEDLYGWGTGGNGEVAWIDYATQPIDPYDGEAMLALGWPDNTYYVYGYAWQNLGQLPEGDYLVEFQHAWVTNPQNKYDSANCHTSVEFVWGFNNNIDDQFDPITHVEWNLNDRCQELEYSDDNWFLMTEWTDESATLTVHDEDLDTYLWFITLGQFSQWGAWVLIDEVYITPPATDIPPVADGFLPEATYIGDELSYPEEEPDYPNWFYWDHFEEEVNDVYEDGCGATCAKLRGKYGPEKTSPADDVDGVWGFDGSFLHITDDSVLLIETKTTAGTCFPDTDEGLADAEAYIEQRRQASEKPLKKCGYEDCAQMSALWIEGTIKDLCNEEDDQKRHAGARIEEAWDAGTLFTTWAAVGFEPSGDEPCLTGWLMESVPAPPKTEDVTVCTEELE